jgi:hypothetical protein
MSRIKIFLANRDPLQPLLDICGGPVQIFQEPIDFSDLFDAGLSNSDVILIPHDAKYWSTDYFNYLKGLSGSKPILYFNRSDQKRYYSLKNSISIQVTRGLKDNQKIILIPYNVFSLRWLPRRPYSSDPVISFVGFLPKLTARRVLNSFIESPKHPLQCNSSLIRWQGLRAIQKSNFRSSIIVRNHYGGAESLINNPETFRHEFIESIKNSDYVFCPRGDANGSQRLYEVISAGRIPIIPFSNTKFPKVIDSDYEKLFIQVSTLSKSLFSEIRNSWTALNYNTYDHYQTSLRELFANHLNYQKYLETLFTQESISGVYKLSF